MSNPIHLTLGQAAKHAGVAKSTITRAIDKGSLSAASKVGNSYRIDPAELQRWQDTRVATKQLDTEKQPDATDGNELSLLVRNAKLEAELATLKASHEQIADSHAELKAMTEKMIADKDREIERLYTLAIADHSSKSTSGILDRMFRRNQSK